MPPPPSSEEQMKLLLACIMFNKSPPDIDFDKVATYVGISTAGAASRRFNKLIKQEKTSHTASAGSGSAAAQPAPKKRKPTAAAGGKSKKRKESDVEKSANEYDEADHEQD